MHPRYERSLTPAGEYSFAVTLPKDELPDDVSSGDSVFLEPDEDGLLKVVGIESETGLERADE